MNTTAPAKVFLSYAPDDASLVREFERHLEVLRQVGLSVWSQSELRPGSDIEREISEHIKGSDIIVFFLSADYLASIRSTREMHVALEQARSRDALIVPIVLRPCLWQTTEFGTFQSVPRDGRPVSSFDDRDRAWSEILRDILTLVEHIKARSQPIAEPSPAEFLPLYEVFKPSGTPSVTFVEPPRFRALKLSLAQPGRGLVVEGPSGIGKTTALRRAQETIQLPPSRSKSIEILSARRADHLRQIEQLPSLQHGTVVVDDFHRLPFAVREMLADYLKFLADYEDTEKKLVIAGIPRTSDRLVNFSFDLATRIDVFRLGRVDDSLVLRMVEQGEKALNIRFARPSDIAIAARGSLNVAQMLCFHLCAQESVEETQPNTRTLSTSLEQAAAQVLEQLEPKFAPTARMFASLGGRRDLTTIEMLGMLGQAADGFVSLEQARSDRPDLADGISRFVSQRQVERVYECLPDSKAYLLYDSEVPALIIDDPQFAFFLAQIPLSKWMRLAGKSQAPKRNTVFISYSHKDTEWLDRLRVHLKPLEREGLVRIWDDTRIRAGSKWRDDIAAAIDAACIAVLLVSASFLASDFIIEHELPPLLAAAEEDGAVICPVIVSPSRFVDTPALAQFQSVNAPAAPLTALGYNEQEELLLKITRTIEATLNDVNRREP